MDKDMLERAEEIANLREQQKMTFKAIGERYQLSPTKVSYLYQAFLRRRRVARFKEWDFITAEYLNRRFSKIEEEKRRKAQKSKDLNEKSIDISDLD